MKRELIDFIHIPWHSWIIVKLHAATSSYTPFIHLRAWKQWIKIYFLKNCWWKLVDCTKNCIKFLIFLWETRIMGMKSRRYHGERVKMNGKSNNNYNYSWSDVERRILKNVDDVQLLNGQNDFLWSNSRDFCSRDASRVLIRWGLELKNLFWE